MGFLSLLYNCIIYCLSPYVASWTYICNTIYILPGCFRYKSALRIRTQKLFSACKYYSMLHLLFMRGWSKTSRDDKKKWQQLPGDEPKTFINHTLTDEERQSGKTMEAAYIIWQTYFIEFLKAITGEILAGLQVVFVCF